MKVRDLIRNLSEFDSELEVGYVPRPFYGTEDQYIAIGGITAGQITYVTHIEECEAAIKEERTLATRRVVVLH